MRHNAVSAVGFGEVERLIRFVYHPRRIRRILRECGNPNAYGYIHRYLAVIGVKNERLRGNRRADLLGFRNGILLADIGQKQRELLAPEAIRHSHVAD